MKPHPDKNGNFVFRQSLLKTVPLVTLTVFSVALIVLSLISIFSGTYINLTEAIVRTAACVAVFAISVFMIIKAPVYVVTYEKILLYGKWELYFSDIEGVFLHDNILGMVEIKGKNGDYTVFSHDVSCPIKVFCEILTERITVHEQRNSERLPS